MLTCLCRSSLAYAISCIGAWDWPEEWPPFFDLIIAAIKSEDDAATHGAMRVLTEFSRDIDDCIIPKVAPVLLPEIYNIFCQEQVSTDKTKINLKNLEKKIIFIFSAICTEEYGMYFIQV